MTGYKDLYLDICSRNKECTQAIKKSERVWGQNENNVTSITFFYFVGMAKNHFCYFPLSDSSFIFKSKYIGDISVIYGGYYFILSV